MSLYKAPGPNGQHSLSFQKNRESVNDSVCNVVLGILTDGKSMRNFNKTHVVLISKLNLLVRSKNFGPLAFAT